MEVADADGVVLDDAGVVLDDADVVVDDAEALFVFFGRVLGILRLFMRAIVSRIFLLRLSMSSTRIAGSS